MLIDIVLLPPKELSDKIGKLAVGISKKYKLKKVVDGKKLLPHCTLLLMNIKPKDIKKVIKEVSKISENQKKIQVIYKKPVKYENSFGLLLERTQDWYKLHKEVVKKVSVHRSSKVDLSILRINKLHKSYIKKYGVWNVLICSSPHFTMGYPAEKKDFSKILKELGEKKLFSSFKALRLAITKNDKNHQVFKIVKEFKLK